MEQRYNNKIKITTTIYNMYTNYGERLQITKKSRSDKHQLYRHRIKDFSTFS